jgi:nitroreductase
LTPLGKLVYYSARIAMRRKIMDVFEAVSKRSSIRAFKPDPVPQTILKEILEAAMSAPSAGNEQPWHFIIINDRKILDEIPKVHPYSQSIKTASVAVVVCGDLKLEVHKDFWVQDCSAATENILIAAVGLGLGTVWIGVHPVADFVRTVRKILSIPKKVTPLCLIYVGYPLDGKPARTQYDEQRVHRQEYGKK